MNKLFFRRGFTLSEVLIVVVIIAVMATLVLPRFSSQRGKAAAAEAIGIMSAIHRALLRFQDENGSFPAALEGNAAIRASALGIDFDNLKTPWVFSTDAAGRVRAAVGVSDILVLCNDGGWNGTGQYSPTTGAFWPHLTAGACSTS